MQTAAPRLLAGGAAGCDLGDRASTSSRARWMFTSAACARRSTHRTSWMWCGRLRAGGLRARHRNRPEAAARTPLTRRPGARRSALHSPHGTIPRSQRCAGSLSMRGCPHLRYRNGRGADRQHEASQVRTLRPGPDAENSAPTNGRPSPAQPDQMSGQSPRLPGSRETTTRHVSRKTKRRERHVHRTMREPAAGSGRHGRTPHTAREKVVLSKSGCPARTAPTNAS